MVHRSCAGTANIRCNAGIAPCCSYYTAGADQAALRRKALIKLRVLIQRLVCASRRALVAR